jgi:histone-lysine N-methyltransferase SETMAR
MNLFPKKVTLCVWWTARGTVRRELLLPAGQTISATVYCQQLERVHEKLKITEPALVTRKGVVLLHDNAKPHVAKMTRETTIRLGWETLVHPPYSQISHHQTVTFSIHLDNHLRGRQFRTLDDVKTALDGFFASRSQEFYHSGVHGLPSRWQKVLDGDRDYF